MKGKLILCGTPIGNLEDMSARGLRVLAEADCVACEDTRRTRKLLSHFGISVKDLIVYNDANERRETPRVVRRISSGETIALVSDAGMPGLSDPGYRLVRACVEAGLDIEVVPGPSAAISALAVSGLPTGRFAFEGFLSRKAGERRNRIEELIAEPRTLIVYESPHRIAACLADLADAMRDRRAAVARELTKLYEEVRRGTLSELAEWAKTEPPRGEIVIVIEGVAGSARQVSDRELAARARKLMGSGVERKEALTEVARDAGVARRRVFDSLLHEEDA